MKILVIAPRVALDESSFKDWTGLDLVMKDLSEGYAAAGHRVCTVTPHVYRLSEGCCVPDWCFQRKRWLARIPFSEMRLLPGVVRAHGPKACLRRARADLFVRWIDEAIDAFAPDIAHIHSSTHWANAAALRCIERGIPFVATLHGINATNPACGDDVIENERAFLATAAASASAITAVSGGTARLMAEIEPALAGRVKVVANGSTLEACPESAPETRKRYGISDNARIMTCIGSVGETKNQAMVIEAFARLCKETRAACRLMIVGRDVSGGRVEEVAHRLGVSDEVIFTGNVSSQEVARILSAATLNVVASKSEGFGLSVIEAMRAGVPSLVYEGIDAFVDFEGLRSVRSFATLSPQCLSEAMSACLAESYDASAIGREGQRYGLTAIIDAYLAVLERARTGVENG